ncbi:MAG TPA: Ig-like domain-containing protein [Candidatus Sulfotelmatobacter sp.]|nr:Ig-like domain-containing protein [Candidatus Sulfotelmatobacter sp.]
MNNRMALTARVFLLRLAVAASIVLACALTSRAGGPKEIAGPTYFDPSTTGQPLTWPQGFITYYTDQGDLSPILPNASANSFVASSFAVWTTVPTAAITAARGGQLAEDVNGTNVILNADGSISMPADIQPTATGTPVGVVYDADGSVTDALLGAGAGDSGECFYNAVFGGDDNFGSLATYQHALIVINGQCAQQSSQLTDVEYRLVRVIGNVLGLGWSQLNVNVQTGSPAPTPADYLGFPVMHFTDSSYCAPITRCYSNPYQLSTDDVAAISRLYPVTTQNQGNFTGKQVFSSSTARIHGSVWFTDAHGNRTQPMQGVNVVARWIDPSTGSPSRQYAASSVSGFSFTGNAGNPITGFDDALGDPFAVWGSNNSSVEGFFDLAGLPLPNGGSAQYQLSVEGIDPKWSPGVGPYSPGPVSPSGTFSPISVTVTTGADVAQDILMTGTGQPLPHFTSSWTSPAALPTGGDWESTLTGYDDISYFKLSAQANRTLSVGVTALDESGKASELKSQPVIGMWTASDPEGTSPPAFTSFPFNQLIFGMTRLDTQVLASGNFLIGISDYRGDGRPDYRYHAHVLYADSLFPSRVSVSGGAFTVLGTGFGPGLSSTIGSTLGTQLAISAGQITLAAPASADGPKDITVSDPVSGASTTMTAALTYGAAASDSIVLLYGLNPSTPVGTLATHPVSVRVVASDGVTPVGGATVAWSATNSVQLSACGGASSCSVLSDQSGYATTWLTPVTVGVANITAALAPASYPAPKTVVATLNAIESVSDIGVASPFVFVSQGSSVSLPITARVLSNGTPKSNTQVNFAIVSGSGSLSAPSVQTSSSGYATVTLTLNQFATQVQMSVCVAPANAPCVTWRATPVPLSQQVLQQVSGAGQISNSGFQPMTVRVTDGSVPPNPIVGAPVVFLTTVLRPGGVVPVPGNGETNPDNPSMPVILQVSQTNSSSDANGLATITPSSGGFSPPLEVDVGITAGTSAAIDAPLWLLPPQTGVSFKRRPVTGFR